MLKMSFLLGLLALLAAGFIYEARGVLCQVKSHNNSLMACGCYITDKLPPGSWCVFWSWTADDAVCDCGAARLCKETEETDFASYNICSGFCGQNKCDMQSMGTNTPSEYTIKSDVALCE